MINLLKKIHLFENLTESELENILTICVKQTFPKDSVICKDGEPGDRCYIITAGTVRVSKFIPNIGEEALAVMKPGDYFGEMALIDNFPRSANVIANEDVDVFAINKSELDKLLTTNRELGYKILWTFTKTLSIRLRETNEKMAAFLAMSGGF